MCEQETAPQKNPETASSVQKCAQTVIATSGSPSGCEYQCGRTLKEDKELTKKLYIDAFYDDVHSLIKSQLNLFIISLAALQINVIKWPV